MPKRRSSDAHFADLTQDVDLEKVKLSIQLSFAAFKDPRRGGNIEYPAWYLLLVILCGYLAGGNSIGDLAHFAELRQKWLAEFSGLDVNAPSYDTIWWFLVRTDPQAFKELMSKWLRGLSSDLKDQLLVIDGKRLRGVSSSAHIVHVVELFAAESRLTLAQEKVPDKAHEAAALPSLLNAVDVRGAVVSMDAHYAHIADVQEVMSRGADYILLVAENGNLD